MNKLIDKVRRSVLKLLARIPTQIPMGMVEFKNWSDSIISIYDFPENDSIRFALATIVLHLGPTAAYKSKHYFAVTLKAAASKQVASAVFQEIKQKQQEARNAAQQAEATALAVASDASQ